MKQSRKIIGNPLKEFEERYKESSSCGLITQENFDIKLGIALNGYNRTYDTRDSKKFLLKFYPDKKIAEVDDSIFHGYTTVGYVAKFLMDNKIALDYHQETKRWFLEKVDEIRKRADEKPPADKDALKERGQNIQKAIINRVREVGGEIDQFIDDNRYSKKWSTDFNIIEYLKGKQLNGLHGRKIVQYLQDEQQELKDIETDEQLQEGYRHMTKKQINYLISLYDYVIGEVEKFITLQNTKRKQVQKPKVAKIEQVLKNFHFLKESEELHLASINPAEIIGSKVCILYNVRYKQLRWIVANDKSGLQIKGSTIYNFNQTESQQRGLRKPEEVLGIVSKCSQTEFFKTVNALTTKASPTTGRSNNDCIILTIFR